jgi:hypothetical protein
MASYDEVKLEDIVHGSFATYNPTTAANQNATGIPIVEIYEEGSSSPLVSGTVTNMTTGRYRWQATVAAASGFEDNKYYEAWVTAAVSGTTTVTQSAPIMSFKATSKVVTDLMSSYTQPTGFLTTTFPAGTVASTTNITSATGIDVSKWNGVAVATPSTGGVPKVDIAYINGVAASGTSFVNVTVTGISPASVGAIATGVWEEVLAAHTGVAGGAAVKLNSAASAGDPWTTTLPGAYTGSQAGKILSDVLTDTAEIGTAGAGLTNINLPNQTMDIVGNITGNLSGSIGSVSTSGITNTSFASGAIDATVMATDAIGSNEISAAAVTKIQTGLATPTNITAGVITTVTNLTNAPTNGDLTTAMKASVNAEVIDVLSTDTHAELGAVPAATSSLKDKIIWLFMTARNKITQTATTQIVKADDGSTTVGTATVSDDGTTFTKGKIS